MEITAQELKNRMEKGEKLYILDVREEWEYIEEHIQGARHFSVYQIPISVNELEDWKENEIIVHCKTGKRGKQAQTLLCEKGFVRVVNMLGGYEAFKML